MAYSTASGPRARNSGWDSIRRRTRARSGDSAWRTVTTKSAPVKTWISPNSHLFHVVEVPGRAQHQEEGVAVVFQLGPLMAGERVVHRQVVQVELLGHGAQLLGVRPVEPDPRHALALPQHEVRLVQVLRVRGPVPVHVHGVVDDSHGCASSAEPPSPGILGCDAIPSPARCQQPARCRCPQLQPQRHNAPSRPSPPSAISTLSIEGDRRDARESLHDPPATERHGSHDPDTPRIRSPGSQRRPARAVPGTADAPSRPAEDGPPRRRPGRAAPIWCPGLRRTPSPAAGARRPAANAGGRNARARPGTAARSPAREWCGPPSPAPWWC